MQNKPTTWMPRDPDRRLDMIDRLKIHAALLRSKPDYDVVAVTLFDEAAAFIHEQGETIDRYVDGIDVVMGAKR